MSDEPYDTKRPTIVVCDPITQLHPKHLPHLMQFYAQNWEKHNLVLHMEMNRPLHKVQMNAVETALEMGSSHVLFTEHDHWGYPVDGLEVLLEQDKDVIGLPTYMRKYPYLPMCMRKRDASLSFITTKRNLLSFYPPDVLSETDLITWAFTLVKTEVFKRMKEAGREPFVWDTVPTDSHFCQHCEEMGIPRYVCAAYFVNHGELPKEHVLFHRRMFDAILASQGRFPIGSLPEDQRIEIANDTDPHGVVAYVPPHEKIKQNGGEEAVLA